MASAEILKHLSGVALIFLMLSSCAFLQHIDLHGSTARPRSDPGFTALAVWKRWTSCQETLRGDALPPSVITAIAALQGPLIWRLYHQTYNLFVHAWWQAVAVVGQSSGGLRALLRLGRLFSLRVFMGQWLAQI